MGVFRSKFIRALPGCGRNARRAFAVAGVSGFLCLLALLLNACGPGVDLERPGRGLAKGGLPLAVPESIPPHVEFMVPPDAVAQAGETFNPVTVSVVDARGEVSQYEGSVQLEVYSDRDCRSLIQKSLVGSPAITSGDPEPWVEGVAVFEPAVNVSGTVYLGANDPSGFLAGACSGPIAVRSGTPDSAQSEWDPPGEKIPAGIPFGINLKIRDSWGNPVTGVNPNQFGFSSSDYDGEGFFNGNASESEAGTYKISFTGTTAGHVTLSADFQGNSVADSIVVQVIAGTATRLVFTTQTGGGVAGQVWRTQPEVEVQDDYGNTVSDYADSVELSLGSTKLFGKSSVIPTNGVATFSGLSVRIAGTGLNLTATSGTLNSASSAPFSVSPGAAAHQSSLPGRMAHAC
ncbi:MAG: hypothetical protein EBX52_01205, partial [Proteobacteria bacterium]|nr:hypothetical protein [Pseudomonadota bacterium]